MRNTLAQISTAVVIATLCLAPQLALSDVLRDGGETQEWNFRVYLDDSEIGYHRFRLTQSADRQQLETEASFEVKFLFFTAYQYAHVNSETWKGDCLMRIESRTATNGKKVSVSGAKDTDAFRVETNGEQNELGGCVKTFAYWNPDFLNADALLNSQTGEMMPIRVETLPPEAVTVNGKVVDASKFRLRARGINLDLWYSDDREWLGLSSVVKGGRTLRYELI